MLASCIWPWRQHFCYLLPQILAAYRHRSVHLISAFGIAPASAFLTAQPNYVARVLERLKRTIHLSASRQISWQGAFSRRLWLPNKETDEPHQAAYDDNDGEG